MDSGIAGCRATCKNITSLYARELDNFLSEFVLQASTNQSPEPYNIISVSEKAKYFISGDADIRRFFSLMDRCREDEIIMHLAEHQTNAANGLMIDLDRYQLSPKRVFTDEILTMLSDILGSAVAKVLDITERKGDRSFHVFFIAKPVVVLDKFKTESDPLHRQIYKDGMHILLPEYWFAKKIRRQIIANFKEMIVTDELVSEILKADAADSEIGQMVDGNAASVPNHFFGSCKVGKIPYQLVSVSRITIMGSRVHSESIEITKTGTQITLRGIKSTIPANISLAYELSCCFSLVPTQDFAVWLIKREPKCIEIAAAAAPLICGAATSLDAQISIEEDFSSPEIRRDFASFDEERAIIADEIRLLEKKSEHLAFINRLLWILDISYASEYEKWFKVLCILAEEGSKAEIIARFFSMRCKEKYSYSGFIKVWDSIRSRQAVLPREGKLSIGSLIFWAKETDENAYKEALLLNEEQTVEQMIYKNDGFLGHSHFSELLCGNVRNMYVVDADSQGCAPHTWFEFVIDPAKTQKHGELFKWRRLSIPHALFIYIASHYSEVLDRCSNRLLEARDSLIHQKIAEQDENRIKELNRRIKRAETVIGTTGKTKKQLASEPFRTSVIKDTEHRLAVRNFAESLDADPEIIGVGNGILRIRNPVQLISGFHEMRVMKFTRADYIPFDENNPQIRHLLSVYHQIYLEDDVFEFMLCYLSTWLDGHDAARILVLLVGGGKNGKSFSMQMAQAALGLDYVKTLKMQLLTSNTERAESANSAFMQLDGIRGGYFDEANAEETLNIARIKSIVSPGHQSGRELFSPQKNFKIIANLCALSNFVFNVPTTDNGTWDRLRLYNNKARFVPHPDPRNPNEHKEDINLVKLKINDPAYQSAMLSILVHYYQIFHDKYGGDFANIPTPTIDSETEEFRNRMDPVNRFIAEMLIFAPNGVVIPLERIVNRYQSERAKTSGSSERGDAEKIASLFENSRIHKLVFAGDDGKKYVRHCRVKERFEDTPDVGESSFTRTTNIE
ncbi:MAG: PriCT-2 domain-containing protein [Methylomonas sp.]|jgi:phage/plasmid-associated DNA primase|uniref:PriCT-2 domain-containing protein n=1 Tax=Methylomonas sp. TaxID=418 RepID=UPI0025D0D42F|nr:PriCT-2 domain-containing protein [Methylomonas sp.]MCK9607791.1 PriCT-2 domain-containing protein [Methylomonas sp.]